MLKTLWQLPQILLGLLLIKITKAVKKEEYWEVEVKNWGVSLGPIILLDKDYDTTTLLHEKGHSKQSMLLGPLYLLIVGVPSAGMNLLTRINILKNENYYKRWPESWADKLVGIKR